MNVLKKEMFVGKMPYVLTLMDHIFANASLDILVIRIPKKDVTVRVVASFAFTFV